MGLDTHSLRFVLEARQQGAALGKMATLGRQTLVISAKDLARLLTLYDKPISAEEAQAILNQGRYIDALMEYLGAESLASFDASDFEAVTHVHDMNRPVPEEFHEQFDLLIDSGTLEHIFDFPTAIKNALSMVKVGGRFIMMTPANNAMGHGFYQFSPELLYRVCHPDNGYTVERMHLLDLRLFRPRVYAVADPAEVRGRVMVTEAKNQALLFMQAVRTETKPIFAITPQQSDYSQRWEAHAVALSKTKTYSKNALIQRFALFLRNRMDHPLTRKLIFLRYKGFHWGSYSPRFFKRIR